MRMNLSYSNRHDDDDKRTSKRFNEFNTLKTFFLTFTKLLFPLTQVIPSILISFDESSSARINMASAHASSVPTSTSIITFFTIFHLNARSNKQTKTRQNSREVGLGRHSGILIKIITRHTAVFISYSYKTKQTNVCGKIF